MNPKIQKWMDERSLSLSDLEEVGAVVMSDAVKFPVYGPSGHWVFDIIRYFDESLARYAVAPQNSRRNHTLYRFNLQARRILDAEYVILVEGITDALALSKLGLPVLALFGSDRPSRIQEALVASLTSVVLVWADGDEAGDLLVQSLPESYYSIQVQGMDPAEAVSAGLLKDEVWDVVRYPGAYRNVVFDSSGILVEAKSLY